MIKELVFVGEHIGIWAQVTSVDSVMEPFTDTARTTTPLTAFDERWIIYLATTNAWWLPYLANKGIQFMHYSTNRVRRQIELDQDILDDFSAIMEFATFVRPFLRNSAFEF